MLCYFQSVSPVTNENPFDNYEYGDFTQIKCLKRHLHLVLQDDKESVALMTPTIPSFVHGSHSIGKYLFIISAFFSWLAFPFNFFEGLHNSNVQQ